MEGREGFDNRDNNEQPAGSAGAPTGIFSSNDLAVETENLPPELGGPQPTQNSGGRVTSVLGRSRQARMAGMNSQGSAIPAGGAAAGMISADGQNGAVASMPGGATNPNATVSTAQGDIELATEKKKSRVSLVVVLTLLVLVGAGVGAWFLFDIPAKFHKASLEDVRTAFYEYANFVLLGEKNSTTTPNIDCDETNTCFFNTQLRSRELTEQFFQDAQPLRQNLQEKLDAWGSTQLDPMDEKKQRLLLNHLSKFDLLKLLYTKEPFFLSTVEKLYVSEGEDTAKEYVKNYYTAEDITTNSYISDLLEEMNDAADAMIDKLESYSVIGCLINGLANPICFDANASDELKDKVSKDQEAMEDFGQLYNGYLGLYETFTTEIKELVDTVAPEELK